MSIFNDAPTGDAPTLSKEELDKINLETLVGEGKKYAEADQLAKAYAHADAELARRKANQADLESQLKVYKDLAEKGIKPDTKDIKFDSDGNPVVDTKPPVDNPPKEETPPSDDISEQIRKELNKAQQEQTFTSNVDSVSERLAASKGSVADATAFVQSKAKELNVSTEWLMDIAGRSPDAFYRTVGLVSADPSQSTPPLGSSDFNKGDGKSDSNKKNFKYYEELRKTDSKAYYSRAVQSEMFENAADMGADFYN